MTRAHGGNILNMWIDVNGVNKGPNVIGRDMFSAVMTQDTIKPTGAPGTLNNDVIPCDPTSSYLLSGYGFHAVQAQGIGCSAKFLYDDK